MRLMWIPLLLACGFLPGCLPDGAGGDKDSGSDNIDTETDADTDIEFSGDEYANNACGLFGDASDTITLAASQSEAATVLMLPQGGEATAWLQLPDSGDGYFVLEVADWMSFMRFFSAEAGDYQILGGEQGTHKDLSDACPSRAMTDQSWYFHEWGSYVIRVDADSPSPLWFHVAKEE